MLGTTRTFVICYEKVEFIHLILAAALAVGSSRSDIREVICNRLLFPPFSFSVLSFLVSPSLYPLISAKFSPIGCLLVFIFIPTFLSDPLSLLFSL